MEVLDSFFNLMIDGKWHAPSEIAKNMQLSERKVEKIVNLFASANFATFNKKTGKAKLNPELCELYDALKDEGS